MPTAKEMQRELHRREWEKRIAECESSNMSQVSTTSNIYCHMFQEAQARTSNAIAEALSFDNKSNNKNKKVEPNLSAPL